MIYCDESCSISKDPCPYLKLQTYISFKDRMDPFFELQRPKMGVENKRIEQQQKKPIKMPKLHDGPLPRSTW